MNMGNEQSRKYKLYIYILYICTVCVYVYVYIMEVYKDTVCGSSVDLALNCKCCDPEFKPWHLCSPVTLLMVATALYPHSKDGFGVGLDR
jgi:hypothetical protein